MTRIIRHVRSNVVGYLALFVALGGTGYAAMRLPAGSVGTQQLKNHSVTPVKLDPSGIGGYVLYWAQISATGSVVNSRPRGARVVTWDDNPSLGVAGGGPIKWGRPIPNACFALATVPEPEIAAGPAATADASLISGNATNAGVLVTESAPAAVNVAVICPVQ